MNGGDVSGLAADALWLTLGFAIPMLAATALVSMLVGMFQRLTQTREAALAWTARFAAVACVLWMISAWVWHHAGYFATELWALIAWVGRL